MNSYIPQARRLAAAMDTMRDTVTDEQALQAPEFFEAYDPNGAYITGNRRTYKGYLYRCLQDHTGNNDPTRAPDVAVSLWVIVTADWEAWHQPGTPSPAGGVYPAYAKDAPVTHNSKRWRSNIDNNTTEPGTDDRWWREVT